MNLKVKSSISAFLCGVATASILLLINYFVLGDVLIQLSALPLMVVTVGGFHIHHFMLSFLLFAIGICLILLKKYVWWGWFLLGMSLILFIDDFKDLIYFIERKVKAVES